MRYLKLFVESFDKYYQEIERGDFLKLSLHSKIPFEDRVYVKIISLFDDEWKINPPGVRNVDGKLRPIDLSFVRQRIISTGIILKTLYVNIFQIEDEWFLVSIRDIKHPLETLKNTYKSWKCDQWDGLVKLLVDEGIING